MDISKIAQADYRGWCTPRMALSGATSTGGGLLQPASSHIFPRETSLLITPGFLPEGFRCGIEILNDDRTPMEFVISILQSGAGLSMVEATKKMFEIHKTGGLLLSMESLEQSRRIAELIVTEARRKGYPLVCGAVNIE